MSDSSKQEYQAVVIGGGIAGVAIVRALDKIGLKDFLVIDSASAFGTKTSGHDAALCQNTKNQCRQPACRAMFNSVPTGMLFAGCLTVTKPALSGCLN